MAVEYIRQRLKSLVAAVDKWLEKPIGILYLVLGILGVAVLLALAITIVNYRVYLESYSLCIDLACVAAISEVFGVQLSLLEVGGKLAAFAALVLGPYAALKGYLSTANAQAFGNHIAHLNFFESFVRAEIGKRERMSGGAVDIYSLYRLMFPDDDGRATRASHEFHQRVENVLEVVKASNSRFKDKKLRFDFGAHRDAMSRVLRTIYISQHTTARIDFLEAEDQLLDFICMLSRVFGEKGTEVAMPKRAYR